MKKENMLLMNKEISHLPQKIPKPSAAVLPRVFLSLMTKVRGKCYTEENAIQQEKMKCNSENVQSLQIQNNANIKKWHDLKMKPRARWTFF